MEEVLRIINSNQKMKELLNFCPLDILSRMEVLSVKEKRFNLFQGESYPFVYIIVSGKIKVFVSSEKGKQIVLDIYTSGNLIGEHEALVEKPYSASLQSMTDCVLLKISARDFKQWLDQDLVMSRYVIHSLCSQMYELTNRAAKYSLGSVKEQVITTLLEHSNNQVISKRFVLDSVSSTPRSVYRLLSELEEEGLIKVSRMDITLLDIEQLKLERKHD